MKDNIIEFMNKIEFINKEIAIYKDEKKGIMFPLNLGHMLTKVDYMELEKQEYEISKFQNKIEDLEYKIIDIEKPVPKNTITGKEEDKYTITTKKVSVRQVWNVVNALGTYKSFNNKEEAMKLAEEINNKIIENINK